MSHTSPPHDDITQALAQDRLGIPGLLFFVMSAAGPLVNVAGVLTLAYAVTGNVGLPSAFIVLGLLLALFAVGYVTMSRHIPHAGAFYAYISRGVSGAAGCSAAWISLLSYNGLQIALYGGVALGAPALGSQYLGVDLPWWVYALLLWALVAVLGVFRVDVNGRVLAVLLVIEVTVIVIYDVAFLAHPAHGYAVQMLSPTTFLKSGAGAIAAIAVLGFMGFESSAVYAEESRRPRRTVPLATYLAIAVIAVLYGGSAWALGVTTGADKIVAESQPPAGGGLVFSLAGRYLGSGLGTLGQVLLMTSLAAMLISIHNTTARYAFALGRERVLPGFFGSTSASGAPRAGSLTQSALGLITILIFAIGGFDPLVGLFYTGGVAGALGIIALLLASSVAVVLFFRPDRRGETLWHTVLAPILATIGLGVVLVLVLANFATLLGVDSGSPLRWGIPAAFLVVAVAGWAYGIGLRARRPQIYAAIGLGAQSSAGQEVVQPAPAHFLPGPVAQDGPGQPWPRPPIA